MLVPGEERASAILHNCEPCELRDQSARQDDPRAHRCNSGVTVVEKTMAFCLDLGPTLHRREYMPRVI